MIIREQQPRLEQTKLAKNGILHEKQHPKI